MALEGGGGGSKVSSIQGSCLARDSCALTLLKQGIHTFKSTKATRRR
jgi:hypothetical protein